MKIKKLSVILTCIISMSLFATTSRANNGDVYIKNGITTDSPQFKFEDDFHKISYLNEQLNTFYDYGKGFKINYMNNMDVDVKMSKVKTVMSNKDLTIEIYYDNFKNTQASSNVYTNYSNKFMDNKDNHKKEYEQTLKVDNMQTRILKWSRPKARNIENDKNYYVSAEIMKNKDEVYTIFIKSNSYFPNYESYMDIIKSFKITKKQATSKINTKFNPVAKNLNEETRNLYNKDFVESDKLKWGIFEYYAPRDMNSLNILEERLDKKFDYVVIYQNFSRRVDLPEGLAAPINELQNAYDQGKTVELTLQTMYNEGEKNKRLLYDILDGNYDGFLNDYARDLKSFNHPVLFRLNNEMNGDWCAYSSYHFSKDTDVYKNVWKYIHNVFEQNGVDNVLWVWNPHDGSFPNFNWNHALNYYPGDEYVDIIGLTGYNAGTYYKGEKWRGFKEIYDPLYSEYGSLFEQPFMITEFGSNSVGGDKIGWINEMFDNINRYKKVKVAIWWNGVDWDTNGKPARTYRLDESEQMLDTFKEGFKPYK